MQLHIPKRWLPFLLDRLDHKSKKGLMTNFGSVTSDRIIGDIVTSEIDVSNGATLTIRGIVNGNIKIHKSSTVIIEGIVNGNIINGGLCKIYGMVNGIPIEQGGEFVIDKKAQIKP
jgi:hypothetical protein